jgi:hypothetical protein
VLSVALGIVPIVEHPATIAAVNNPLQNKRFFKGSLQKSLDQNAQ